MGGKIQVIVWIAGTTSVLGRWQSLAGVRVECQDIELRARTPEIESRGYGYSIPTQASVFLRVKWSQRCPICQNLGMTSTLEEH